MERKDIVADFFGNGIYWSRVVEGGVNEYCLTPRAIFSSQGAINYERLLVEFILVNVKLMKLLFAILFTVILLSDAHAQEKTLLPEQQKPGVFQGRRTVELTTAAVTMERN